MVLVPLLKGFGMGLSLIAAIGMQNAFVMKQGLKRNHLFLTASTCFLGDALLIALGVLGIGLLFEKLPLLSPCLRWGGAAFLIVYGLRAFQKALSPHGLHFDMQKPQPNIWITFLTLLAFTFLNPHVYIDSLIILGSTGAQHPPEEQIFFIIGATAASLLWFFGLTYGASALSPFFQNPRAWQKLHLCIGCFMFLIAGSLILYL